LNESRLEPHRNSILVSKQLGQDAMTNRSRQKSLNNFPKELKAQRWICQKVLSIELSYRWTSVLQWSVRNEGIQVKVLNLYRLYCQCLLIPFILSVLFRCLIVTNVLTTHFYYAYSLISAMRKVHFYCLRENYFEDLIHAYKLNRTQFQHVTHTLRLSVYKNL
jgi:hypothetical protein